MRTSSRDGFQTLKRQEILNYLQMKQATVDSQRVPSALNLIQVETRNRPQQQFHASSEKNRSSLLMGQRLNKAQSIKLPLLKTTHHQEPQQSIVQKNRFIKDWGLSEEEKQIYGDRTPQNLTKMELLGKGGFALVWLCQDVDNQYRYAAKQISRQQGSVYMREQRFFQHFFANRDKTYEEGYQNLIEIKSMESSSRDIWILQELGGKTLSKAMYTLKGEFFKGERVYSITETEMTQAFYKQPQIFVQLLKEILQGINLINKQGFTHCDLKPENILIEFDGQTNTLTQVKIIDYGSSFTFQDQENIGMVTPEYMAPEVLEIIHNWSKYSSSFKNQVNALKSVCETSQVDIWSFGAIILDMLVGIPHWLSYKGKIVRNGRAIVKFGLFANKGRELDKIMVKQVQISQQLDQIVRENGVFLNAKQKLQLTDLLKQILLINAADRTPPWELLNHSFFS